ncbi:MAG: Phosphopentomutase [Firmicutes bacterium]|nr:Phosphopentomutase [candidate division NPL-UPA2 bacterium]
MQKTVVFIVLDSVGVGALPDANLYGDHGSNTLKSVLDYNPSLTLPNLTALGLGEILPHPRLISSTPPMGAFGRGITASPAKDTITGHWEMAGIVLGHPFRTFPAGFPRDVVRALSERTGREFIGNVAASGTEIIRDLGREHQLTGAPILYTSADSVMQIAARDLGREHQLTGAPILYTSADSVMQIAAHEDVVPLAELYSICQVARQLMQREFNVARIIARPFSGEWPYVRTPNRRDLAVAPPGQTMLDIISRRGLPVIGIGKICDIYAGHGPTQCLKTKNTDPVSKD